MAKDLGGNPRSQKMVGKSRQEKRQWMRLQCRRCDVAWESQFDSDFCCSGCRRGQEHTDRCWERRLPLAQQPRAALARPMFGPLATHNAEFSTSGSAAARNRSRSPRELRRGASEEEDSGSGSENEDTMAVASEAKSEVWRHCAGLLDDTDFAFYFSSHKEATLNAGRAVADAWSKIRTLQLICNNTNLAEPVFEKEKECERAKRKAKHLEDNPAEPLRKKQAVGKPKWKAGSKASRAIDNTEASEDKAKFVPVLVDIMTKAGALKERGCSEAAWQASLQRRAVARVEKSEKETLTRVQRTWEELASFAQRDGLHIAELGVVSLETFLFEGEAQARALAALRWMRNNLYLKWPIQDLMKPEKSGPIKHYSSQATCAEPAMVAKLEEAIEKMQKQGNPSWLGLLSQWLQAIGVLRLKHIKRSTPMKLTSSTLHAWCHKGKQKNMRGGFKWSAPASFISRPTFNWAKKFLDEWKKVPAVKRNKVGMAFDTEKFAPLTNKACIDMARTAMGPLVTNEEELSTYSWRRVMPTLGLAAHFSGTEMMALGDWQDKSMGGKEVSDAKMPLHYSDNKEELSKRIKHEAAIILGSIMCFNVWEATPESSYRQARQDPGNQSKLDKILEEDAVVIWKRPIPFGQGKRGFQLKSAKEVQQDPVQLRSVKDVEKDTVLGDILEKDESTMTHKMPKIANKVLSTHDKAGVALCAGYQTGDCQMLPASIGLRDKCPQGKHACAVLLRSSRTCGSSGHTAEKCWNKKAITPKQYKLSKGLHAAARKKEEAQRAGQEVTLGRTQVVTLKPNADYLSSSSSSHQKPQKVDSSPEPAAVASSSRAEQKADSSPEPAAKARPAKGRLKKAAGEVWDSVYDELAKQRFRKKGNKYRPEPPTLIAKVRKQGGELWLGGLPLEENLQALKGKNISIQIHCFNGDPTSRTIKDNRRGTREVRGKQIPGALVLQLNMDKPKEAEKEWPDVIRTVYSSLHQGDNAYVHCMAGVHRAGLTGPMMRSSVHGETFDEALKQVGSVRQIRPESVIRDFGRPRINAMLSTRLTPPTQRPAGWAEFRKLIHAMVKREDGTSMPLCTWNQKEDKAAARAKTNQQCSELMKGTKELGDWLVDVSKGFCSKCKAKVPASFLVQAMEAGLH